MKNNVLLLAFLFCCFINARAQQDAKFHIGIEYGLFEFYGKIDDRWDFRQTTKLQSSYWHYYGSETAYKNGNYFHVGLKPQLTTWNGRLTLASGLRYTNVKESITAESTSSPLFMYGESQQGIELFRVNRIDETLGYLTVPLEADIGIIGNLHTWAIFVKGGIQAGMKIHGKTTIDFVSNQLDGHNDEILASIGKDPSSFFSTIYTSAGVRFVLRNGMRLSLESPVINFILSKDNFTLVNPYELIGMQLSVAFPVNFSSKK